MTKLGVAILAAACESAYPTVQRTTDAGHPDGKVVVLHDGDPDVPFTHLQGTATSAVVPFGGSGYCDYTVQLTNVVVDAIVHGSTEVTTMTASYHMVEMAPGCQYAPAPPTDDYFDHQGGPTADTGNGFAPMLVGRGGNSPTCTGNAAVTLGGAPAADLTFARTDQVPLLDWTVNVPGVALAPATCFGGESACYGGAIEGAVFTCNGDGATWSPTTICANGCADSFSCR